MSTFSEPTWFDIQGTLPLQIDKDSHSTRLLTEPNNHQEPAKSLMKRSEILRPVFSRPSRHYYTLNQKHVGRVARPAYRRNTFSTSRHTRSRFTFHKVITSILDNSNSPLTISHLERIRTPSSASSIHSKPVSVRNSIQHLEIVSLGAFISSGSMLKSTNSRSPSDFISQPSNSVEHASESHSLHPIQATLISDDRATLLYDRILEPFVDDGIHFSMSNVPMGTSLQNARTSDITDVDEDVRIKGLVYGKQLPRKPAPTDVTELYTITSYLSSI